MKKYFILSIALALFIIPTSCKKGAGDKTFMPSITGAAGEVVVVVNKSVIDDSIVSTLKSLLEAEYPMIPQPEPLFNIALVPTQNFTDIFKTHRNIVLVKVDDQFKEAKMVVQRDVWSAPQILINLVGPTYPSIERLLKSEKDRFIQLLEQAERDRVAQNAKKFEVEPLRQHVKQKFDLSIYFPKGYSLNIDTTDFTWISYETPKTSQGIFIYQYPYTDSNTFTQEYLIEKRNSFVNKFIQGPTSSSYMSTETIISPTFLPLMFNNRYFGQLRGLWTVEGHPMGGPFISLTTLDEQNNRVITIEGYVFAPRLNKRNYVRQVEALLLSTEFPEKEE